MDDGRTTRGSRRSACGASSDSSLERLGVDRVDLYLAHEPDPATPIAETLGAFEELAAAGMVAAWGLSNYGAGKLRRRSTAARRPCSRTRSRSSTAATRKT